jgi:serralysin
MTSATLELLETTFGQDINGDGTIGPKATLIQTDTGPFGTTSLTQVGNEYFLYNSGSGPALSYFGSPVAAGQFPGWTPIGAVETASGYDVAWKLTGGDGYSVWSVGSNGNFTGNYLAADVAGTSAILESLETTFGQDLNGDGTIGPKATLIQTDTGPFGTISLTQVGNEYFLYNSGSGPALSYFGSPVAAGQFGGWTPIGAVETASGYDVAWKLTGGDGYSVWSVGSNGNFTGNYLAADVSGSSATLESLETIFGQDLDGDGVIGLHAAPGTTLQIGSASAGALGAATIGAHATLEVAAADSASVTFAASTGMLKLDQPSTFSAEMFGFSGDGTLSGSDQIDLKGINYNTVQDSYANGVLTVTDGTDAVHLNFSGSYSLGNFKFASDGNGGTIVYDPPVADAVAPAAAPRPASGASGNNIVASAPNATLVGDGARDTFIFPPNFGHAAIDNYVATNDAIQFSHATFASADAALAAAHDYGHGNVVMADAAHDALTLHNITAAQLHHSHLLIV